MRVLVAEDDEISARMLVRTFERSGYTVDVANDGDDAIELLGEHRYDVVVTDWMMPGTDGIGVVRAVRSRDDKGPAPLVLMVTALGTAEARAHAVLSGADGFLTKPVRPSQLLDEVRSLFARRGDVVPAVAPAAAPPPAPLPPTLTVRLGRPAFAAVAIAASTGGPMAVREFLEQPGLSKSAAYLVVIHGPAWMMESCVGLFGKACSLEVRLADAGQRIVPGTVTLARGDRHLVVTDRLTVELLDTPEENFVRPAADPLFRTLAQVFREDSVGVVLTGLGKDAAAGAAAIAAAGGSVFVQDPATCTAPHMPKSALAAVPRARVGGIPELAQAVARHLSPARTAAAC